MQLFYVHWNDKTELKSILQELQEHGYRNICALTTKYRFPVIVVDPERKIFFDSHASYMSALMSCGKLKLYAWKDFCQHISF